MSSYSLAHSSALVRSGKENWRSTSLFSIYWRSRASVLSRSLPDWNNSAWWLVQ